jgi:hypothetical protein
MEDDPNEAEEPVVSARTREGNPRTQGAAREPVTRERIAERAYLISQSEQGGSDEENWLRAERELLEEKEQQER